jgi:DNA-directed RNA polymerase subunit RPC12/RpoP
MSMKYSPKDLPANHWFPTRTRGDGRIRANSARSGEGQGKGKSSRYVHCKQCGFLVDKTRTNHSGGTQEGNGGIGPVTKTAFTTPITDSNGDRYVDGVSTVYGGTGDATVEKGSACPLCGSRNFLG